ncbi:hypothetical protein [Cyclobacterium xiamenense]|uniref:hypothetical protein n=1 Tax=Cyclobacterium xiamenense TaxID=1297121 RepID=UPI0035CEFE5D
MKATIKWKVLIITLMLIVASCDFVGINDKEGFPKEKPDTEAFSGGGGKSNDDPANGGGS